MARVVSDPDWLRSQRGVRYPWSEWLDGQAWELEQGTDFTQSLDSMRALIAGAAIRRGGKARTRRTGEKTILVQFYLPYGTR